MNAPETNDSVSQTKARKLKQSLWECEADATTLSGMLEGLDLMNSEGDQYEAARVAITREALDNCRQLSADLEKLEKMITD